MADHADHVHVGDAPQYGPASSTDEQVTEVLEPEQWRRLIDQISTIDNPAVPTSPSKFAEPAKKRHGKAASPAHRGE